MNKKLSYKTISGINIQWPWSYLLAGGKKIIETRSYKLPECFKNVELAIIETPGKHGKKNGVSSARIIGVITFVDSYQYKTKKSWERDYSKHLVMPDDSLFKFSADKDKWGWVVGRVEKLNQPVKPPSKRGIIFAKNCKVPLV